jgi:hypothetical protein
MSGIAGKLRFGMRDKPFRHHDVIFFGMMEVKPSLTGRLNESTIFDAEPEPCPRVLLSEPVIERILKLLLEVSLID